MFDTATETSPGDTLLTVDVFLVCIWLLAFFCLILLTTAQSESWNSYTRSTVVLDTNVEGENRESTLANMRDLFTVNMTDAHDNSLGQVARIRVKVASTAPSTDAAARVGTVYDMKLIGERSV